MPEFVNPFVGMAPSRKMTASELIRAIRLNIAAELEAVHLYMAHADATDDELAKKVLIDIANEERVHAGEFQRLISILDPEEDAFLAEGAAEVNEMAEGAPPMGPAEGGSSGNDARGESIPTVGDMRRKPQGGSN